MATTQIPIDITFRHIDNEQTIKQYALKKLSKVIYALPNLRSASVEIFFEHTRPVDQRYGAQVTLAANGTLLRAEERGEYPNHTVDRVHDLPERRIRDWKGRVYFARRRESAVYQERTELQNTALPPRDQTGRIVRMKSPEIKPMFVEDAVEQMELLGHDFFFFLNAGTGQHNVVYRRKVGGYGLIEPAIANLETPSVVGEEGGPEGKRPARV